MYGQLYYDIHLHKIIEYDLLRVLEKSNHCQGQSLFMAQSDGNIWLDSERVFLFNT